MTLEPVLIDGEWRPAANPAGSFCAVDPSTKARLPHHYPVSGNDDVDRACAAALEAVAALRALPVENIAAFLDEYAARIEAHADSLVSMAALETALPATPRLRSVELPRTMNQLRQAAVVVRERSWCHATIDTKANIRSMFAPMGGPVVVFGPNNFPFAFNSVAGGDFVAAIAAGNPVIGKANTGHPGTSRMLAEIALEAVTASGLPRAMVQLIYRTPPDVGFRLVSHPAVVATGFTGSKGAGLQLKAAAEAAGKPIYLEMSSVNPVFVLPGALEERLDQLAGELFDSCALGAGQFCTRPGLTIVQAGEPAERFVAAVDREVRGLDARHAARQERRLRHRRGGRGHRRRRRDGPRWRATRRRVPVRVREHAAARQRRRVPREAAPAADGGLRDGEPRGRRARPAADGRDRGRARGQPHRLRLQSTTGADDAAYAALAPVLRQRVGRLLNDKMPTGVAVSPAMNHGGPYPATGHPGFTAVGMPASLLRFAALHCYDNVRPARLPAELGDRNPTGRCGASSTASGRRATCRPAACGRPSSAAGLGLMASSPTSPPHLVAGRPLVLRAPRAC